MRALVRRGGQEEWRGNQMGELGGVELGMVLGGLGDRIRRVIKFNPSTVCMLV